jgi:hypothetical protein
MRNGVVVTREGCRIISPEGGAQPPGDYACWDDYMRDIEGAETSWRDEIAQRGIACWMLAPNLTVYRALMRGEDVPVAALDPYWARRYGLR